MDFQRQECVIQTDRHKSLWLRAGGETHLLLSSLLSPCLSSLSFLSILLLSFLLLLLLLSTVVLTLPSHLVSSSVQQCLNFPFLSSPLLCYLLLSNSPWPIHFSCLFLISSPPFFYLESFWSLRSGAHVESQTRVCKNKKHTHMKTSQLDNLGVTMRVLNVESKAIKKSDTPCPDLSCPFLLSPLL